MRKTVYRSGVDLWLIVFVFGVVAGVYGVILFTYFSWSMFITGVLLLTIIAWALFDIKYIILDNSLIVSCFSGLFKSTFDIKEITSVRATRTIQSSPAASLDRLEVKCGRRSVVLSPRKKQEFLAHLLKINQAIRVEK